MKASTLFGITVAVLLGVGAVAGAKMLGVFERQPLVEQKQEPIKILAAKRNIYEGVDITPDQVYVRNLYPSELAQWQNNKEKYLPALTEAAVLRTPIQHIESDRPILKEYLADLNLPNPTPGPGMRSVNVVLPRDRAGGGLIFKGDRVDVLLTSQICDGDNCEKQITLGAYVARNLRVITKRNSLFTVMASNAGDSDIQFTLEANPYRAALLEYALTKGQISLLRTSPAGTGGVQPAAVDPSLVLLDSPEFREDPVRSDRILRGEMSISDVDLERIFKLKPIVRTPPPPPPLAISQLSGVNTVAVSTFDHKGNFLGHVRPGTALGGEPAKQGGSQIGTEGQSPLGYAFSTPGAATRPGAKPGST